MIIKSGELFEWKDIIYRAIDDIKIMSNGWVGMSRRLFVFTVGLNDEDRSFVLGRMGILFTEYFIQKTTNEEEKSGGEPVQDYPF